VGTTLTSEERSGIIRNVHVAHTFVGGWDLPAIEEPPPSRGSWGYELGVIYVVGTAQLYLCIRDDPRFEPDLRVDCFDTNAVLRTGPHPHNKSYYAVPDTLAQWVWLLMHLKQSVVV